VRSWHALAGFIGWTVVVPAIAYAFIEHTLHVYTAGQRSLAVVLGTCGFVIYVVRQMR